MSVKDILAIVISATRDEAALRAADLLAQRFGKTMSAAYLTALPDEPVSYEPTLVAGVWAELLGRARQEATAERAAVQARLGKMGHNCELRTGEALARDLGRLAALQARYSDIAVLTRPGAEESADPRYEVVEGVLFHSGRPALIVPPDWQGGEIGKRPLLAWDASREATRALSEADWLIADCASVTVLTIDAKTKAFGHGEAPGANIAAHLQRRGLAAEVRNTFSGDRTPAQSILDEAAKAGADLIVMGGYHHARLRAMMFGGATRDILAAAPVPVLMAH
jgi:nucleotide-binding universal stress UspA family protein